LKCEDGKMRQDVGAETPSSRTGTINTHSFKNRPPIKTCKPVSVTHAERRADQTSVRTESKSIGRPIWPAAVDLDFNVFDLDDLRSGKIRTDRALF